VREGAGNWNPCGGKMVTGRDTAQGRWTMDNEFRYSKIFKDIHKKKKELDFGFFPVGYLVWILTMYNIEHSPGLFLLILVPVR
jgi:hypothetical protein